MGMIGNSPPNTHLAELSRSRVKMASTLKQADFRQNWSAGRDTRACKDAAYLHAPIQARGRCPMP